MVNLVHKYWSQTLYCETGTHVEKNQNNEHTFFLSTNLFLVLKSKFFLFIKRNTGNNTQGVLYLMFFGGEGVQSITHTDKRIWLK